ncbi:hypothetical protein HHX47_DHR10000264 [Lentinula edodes]|nr:hypothetical protein HHX47_DHR10000264 [Lentinula edodes]
MLFLTTLLPLITLALRVAAADLEQGIPLGSVSHPANVHLSPPTYREALRANPIIPSGPPPTYREALGADPTIPTIHYGNNAQQSVSHRCLEELTQRVPHATNLEVFVGRAAEAKDRLDKFLNKPECKIAVVAAGLVVLLIYAGTGCHWADEAIHCRRRRRNELGDGHKIEQCERLPIEINACSNPSRTDTHLSPVASKAPGGHGKRDAARMSYRRRLELE